jgi:hypothetical protein
MKKNRRGRPSLSLLDKYNFNLDKISEYFNQNFKEELKEIEVKQSKEENKEQDKEQIENNKEQEKQTEKKEEIKNENEIQQKNILVFDKNMLIKADIVFSAILETVFEFLNIKKEVSVIEEKEADFLIDIMPPLRIERSWTSFLTAYLIIKVIK